MSFEVSFPKNRTADKLIRIFERDGVTPVVLAPGDVVRFKAYRRDQAAPALDVDSAADSADGSGIRIDSLDPAVVTLRIAQQDTAGLDPGIYDAEVCVVDDSEVSPADAIKQAESGIVVLLGTAGGEVGLA